MKSGQPAMHETKTWFKFRAPLMNAAKWSCQGLRLETLRRRRDGGPQASLSSDETAREEPDPLENLLVELPFRDQDLEATSTP
jgi:hypothetical protein